MMNYIFLNNEFIRKEEGSINICDRGFTLGDGVFETICVKSGVLQFLDAHMMRLKSAVDEIDIVPHITFSILKNKVIEIVEKNRVSNGSCRVTITRGMSERGIGYLKNRSVPTILITTADGIPPNNPIRCKISEYVVNDKSPLANFKTTNYLENIMAQSDAIKSGFDDAVLMNTNAEIVSSTVGNIFFVYENCVITPPLESGCLNGITRMRLIQYLNQMSIKVLEKSIKEKHLSNINACFMTNSIVNVKLISQINEHKFDIDNDVINFIINNFL